MDESHDILRRALSLASAIYRLTERLPGEEALVGQLRRAGIEVVGDLTMDNFQSAQKKIELLVIYFKIGRAQNWVREINWLILEKECRRLSQEIIILSQIGEVEREVKTGKKAEVPIMSHNVAMEQKFSRFASRQSALSSRQKKILEETRKKEPIKMSDLTPLFKNTASERTIRNDLQILLKKGLIDKTGAHKTTVYFLR